MNKLNLLLGILIGLTILSCSSDDDNNQESNNSIILKSVQVQEKLFNESEINYSVNYILNSEGYVESIEFGNNQSIFIYDNNNIIEENFYVNNVLNEKSVFTYDIQNRRIKKEVYYNGNSQPDEIINYFYNSNNQLISTDDENYTYDSDGNLATLNYVGGTETTYFEYEQTNNPLKNLRPINYFFYRTNNNNIGNLISEEQKDSNNNSIYKQVWSYEYSNLNYPTKRTLVSSEGTSELELNVVNYTYE
jgi:hypothetical protein